MLSYAQALNGTLSQLGNSIESSEITQGTIVDDDISTSQINTTHILDLTILAGDIANDAIGDTQLAFNTGQTLTTAGTPTFAGLTLTGNLAMGVNDITADKVDANTFDPVYNIKGVKYATYLPGMSG